MTVKDIIDRTYRLCWPTGADRMLLLSIGTGPSPKANQDLAPEDMNLGHFDGF
jgi:hypothetical protein